MYPHPESDAVVAAMKANRRTDTRPEVVTRALLHARGFRFRKDYFVKLPGMRGVRVDIAFPKQRLAIFIDGCFWHGCPEHGHAPRRNQHYWLPKLKRNFQRDRVVTEALAALGWNVLRFWEHVPAEEVVERIAQAHREARSR